MLDRAGDDRHPASAAGGVAPEPDHDV